MSEHKKPSAPSFFELDEIKFDDNEPDTGSVVNAIVEDQKTPGNAKSFLAIFGYMRAVDRKHERRFDSLDHRDRVRMAWIAGAIFVGVPLTSALGLVLYELVVKPLLFKH